MSLCAESDVIPLDRATASDRRPERWRRSVPEQLRVAPLSDDGASVHERGAGGLRGRRASSLLDRALEVREASVRVGHLGQRRQHRGDPCRDGGCRAVAILAELGRGVADRIG